MWDGDTDDYEYQQASMEMSGPDDDLLAERVYAPQSGEEFFLDREDTIRVAGAELYNFKHQNRFDDDELLYVDSDDSPEGSITIRDGFVPRLKAILSKYKKLVDAERYQSAIRELSSITCNEDNDNLLDGFFYDDSDGLYYDTCGHTNDDAFFGVNIHYIKNLDSRLLLIFPKYTIKRYGFSRWYAGLSKEQREYVRGHIDAYSNDLTDKQTAVLKLDIKAIDENTIKHILVENDDEFICEECWNYDGFVDHHTTRPLEGTIFRDFKIEQFDGLVDSIPKLDLDIVSAIINNYPLKISDSLWAELVKRLYAEAIIDFNGNIKSIFYEIDFGVDNKVDCAITRNIKADIGLSLISRERKEKLLYPEWLNAIKSNRDYYAQYAKELGERMAGSPIDISYNINVILEAKDYYDYYLANIYKRYRRTGADSYHLWGLEESYNMTKGRKLRVSVEDNVLSFIQG